MGVLLFLGIAWVWEFCLLSVLSAAAKAILRPATSGLVAQTVPAAELQSANALLSLASSIPLVAGPAAAGILSALSLQRVVPSDRLARVTSYDWMVSLCTNSNYRRTWQQLRNEA
jgi:MFS family permease